MAALAAYAAGAPLRAVALGVLAGLVARFALGALGRGRRGARSAADALIGFARDWSDGRLDARLPGTWAAPWRAVADAVNEMAASVERRFADSEARRTRLEAVIEAMEDAVLVVDADERVLFANPRLRAWMSTADLPEPVEGRSLLELVRHAEVVDALRAALRHDRAETREIRLEAGGERVLRFRAAPFVQPDGSCGALAVFHDVTELRRVEAMRRDFVANASHELKTPLTSIRGYAERLLDQELGESSKHSVEAVVANARRLHLLVEDLLELSRIESGTVPLVPEAVEVGEVARRLLRDLEPRLRASELETRIEGPEGARVWADRRALEQVLANLLDNAVKYSPQGGSVTVRIASAEGGRLRIEVEDTGIGIPRRDLPRIFERFYRVDPGRSRALGGTGLGLAIVKHLAQAMSGQLGVESQPGIGSRFWIELPRFDAPSLPRTS